jgi:hypothetical protein
VAELESKLSKRESIEWLTYFMIQHEAEKQAMEDAKKRAR